MIDFIMKSALIPTHYTCFCRSYLCFHDFVLIIYTLFCLNLIASLKELDVSFNRLTSMPSTGWWKCDDLELLNLAGNHFFANNVATTLSIGCVAFADSLIFEF